MLPGRSKPVTIAIQREVAEVKREVLAAGHCVEAFYDAHGEQPNNLQIRATLHAGLRSVDLKQETPIDVQREIVVLFNRFNKGSGYNPQQLIDHLRELEADWDAECKKRGWKVRTLTITKYEQFYNNCLFTDRNTQSSKQSHSQGLGRTSRRCAALSMRCRKTQSSTRPSEKRWHKYMTTGKMCP